MKTTFKLTFVAAAAALLFSCTQESYVDSINESSGVPMKQYTFKAESESTKTLLDGFSVKWEDTDKVRVFYKYNEESEQKTGYSDATAASTEGTSATFVVNLPETVILDTLYAVYKPLDTTTPYTWKTKGNGITNARVMFQTVQTAVKGGFDKDAVPMVARWINSGDNTPSFSFNNLSALLKIDVDNQSSYTLDSIVLKTTTTYFGKYYWGFKPKTDIVRNQRGGSGKSVNFVGPFEGEGTYYLSVPFNTSLDLEGISLSFYNGKRCVVKSNPATLSIERNKIYPFGSFTVTDDWFPSDDSFKVTCETKSRADRDTTYYVNVSAGAGIAWTAVADNDKVSLSPASGTGSAEITVKVPTNYSTTTDVNYTVTVSTEDTSIEEESRSQDITLTQAHETKVLFGTKWGNSFIIGWNDNGFKASTEYQAEYAIASASKELKNVSSSTAAYIRGKYNFKFKAGETGKGTLSFKARLYGNKKTVKVTKTDIAGNVETVFSFKSTTPSDGTTSDGTTSDITRTFTTDPFSVEKDDLITISSTDSDSHYLYCNDTNPISWTKAE